MDARHCSIIIFIIILKLFSNYFITHYFQTKRRFMLFHITTCISKVKKKEKE